MLLCKLFFAIQYPGLQRTDVPDLCSKMLSISTCTLVLIVSLCSQQVLGDHEIADLTPLASTCSLETAAEVFSSVFFIDIISAKDPEVVFGLRLSPDIAADRFYDVHLRIYHGMGFRNAEHIASTVASAVYLVDVFTLPLYFLTVGKVVGEFFVEKGLLDCGNVIERATEYFENEESIFQNLDPAELESYVEAIVEGLEDLLEELGYSIEENEVNWQILADLFYTQIKKNTS